MVHNFPPGGEFISFFHIDEGNSVGTTNSAILIGWIVDGDAQLRAWIRDGDNGSSSEEFHNLGHVPADGDWHHVAVVKRGTTLEGYLDSQRHPTRTTRTH